MWRKFYWNEEQLKTNDLGELEIITPEIFGEISLIKVYIGESGPETKLEFFTSEGETIIYENITKDFIDYPIHAGNPTYMSFSGGEKVDNLVKYLNCGDLLIKVSGDPNTALKRIVLILES